MHHGDRVIGRATRLRAWTLKFESRRAEKKLMKNRILWGFCFVAIYFALGRLGLTMATINHNASPIWPAAGFALFVLSRFGFQFFPAIFLGALFTNMTTPAPFVTAVGIAFANTAEALVSAFLLAALNRNQERDEFSTHMGPLSLVLSTLAGSMVGATLGNASLFASDLIPLSAVRDSWITWLLGDFLGGVMFFPLLSLFWQHDSWLKVIEQKTWLLLGLGLSVGVAFWLNQVPFGSPWIFTVFYLALLGMFFAKSEVVYLCSLVFYASSIWSTLHQWGPFSHGDLNSNFIYLQIFFGCFAISLEMLRVFAERGVLRHAALVLLVGWMALATAYSNFIKTEFARNDYRFNEMVTVGSEAIDSKMAVYEGILRSAAGFVSSQKTVSQAEWLQFVNAIDVDHRFPGLRGIGFMEPVPKHNSEAWLRRVKAEYNDEFSIHDVPDYSSQPDAAKFVITHIEPLARNKSALGLNVFSEPRRKLAIQKAFGEKLPTATEPIVLVQDSKQRPGFLFFVPVYGPHQEQRGVVYAPVVYDELLNAALESVGDQLQVRATMKNISGIDEEVYSMGESPGTLSKETKTKVLDKTLVMKWQSSKVFVSKIDATGAWIIGVGGLLCLLISVVMANLQMVGEHAGRIASEATRDLKLSQAQLVKSAKFSALGEMAGGIAHEINNPLSIISARVEQIQRMIEQKKIDEKRLGEFAESIAKTVKRISSIVVGLRTFSRSGDGEEFLQVPVKSLVEETVSFCHERCRQFGVDVSVDDFKGIFVQGRHTQLSQVLLNLMNNSLDATKGLGERWIRISGEESEGFFCLRVTDSGDGIAPAVVDKLMQPFFTTKEVGKGTGLGLSLSKGIMEDHKGELRYSLYQGHTSFVMRMPIQAVAKLQRVA